MFDKLRIGEVGEVGEILLSFSEEGEGTHLDRKVATEELDPASDKEELLEWLRIDLVILSEALLNNNFAGEVVAE